MASNKMTTKTLGELNELLNSEELAFRKCCNYSTICSDPVLKTKFGQYANRHKARFEVLLNYLNTHE